MKESILVQILSNLLLQQGKCSNRVVNQAQDATQVTHVRGFLKFEFSPLAPGSINDEESSHPIQNPDSMDHDILQVDIVSSWIEEIRVKSLKNGDEVTIRVSPDDELREDYRKLLITMLSNGRSIHHRDPYVVSFGR